MGWKWKYTCSKKQYTGNSCFHKRGVIDYSHTDQEYIQKTADAIEWIHEVRENCREWDLSETPLPHPNLYPNMCNRYDYPYHKIKKQFAHDINDITMIWKCGPIQRKCAIDNKVYSWTDKRCTAQTLGITSEFTGNIVSRILEVNQNPDITVLPKYIKNNEGDWKFEHALEFFVDFEMTCSVFSDFDTLPYSYSESIIFMIGIGYIDPITEEWSFKNFTVDRLIASEEHRVCSEFIEHIMGVMDCYDVGNAPVYD